MEVLTGWRSSLGGGPHWVEVLSGWRSSLGGDSGVVKREQEMKFWKLNNVKNLPPSLPSLPVYSNIENSKGDSLNQSGKR